MVESLCNSFLGGSGLSGSGLHNGSLRNGSKVGVRNDPFLHSITTCGENAYDGMA